MPHKGHYAQPRTRNRLHLQENEGLVCTAIAPATVYIPLVRGDAHLAGAMLVTAAALRAICLVARLAALDGLVVAPVLDRCTTAIEVIAEVVVLPQLELEEGYHSLELPACLGVLAVGLGRADLLDGFVEVATDSVLTATVQVSLLRRQ